MADAIQLERVKLIVTGRGTEPGRYLRSALRRAVPGARARSTGFRGIFALEGEGDPAELARLVWGECAEKIGHVTAVIAVVESKEEPIRDAATQIAAAQVGLEESFCFRLHKRGAHGLDKDSATLEREIGGAIGAVLEGKYRRKPRVELKNPDITVIAEILGGAAAVGISRRAWR